jgi:hypothetical protein
VSGSSISGKKFKEKKGKKEFNEYSDYDVGIISTKLSKHYKQPVTLQ